MNLRNSLVFPIFYLFLGFTNDPQKLKKLWPAAGTYKECQQLHFFLDIEGFLWMFGFPVNVWTADVLRSSQGFGHMMGFLLQLTREYFHVGISNSLQLQ